MELRVENLCKSYGDKTVLRKVSFTAGEGVTCIMAPSGGGKTTLLRIVLGLERQDSGTVAQPPGCRWAAVFQDDRLLEQLDAMGNLRFALGGELEEKEACRLLGELGLGAVGGQKVRTFSGGMKRRLALARALLAKTEALALDEPFAGLDGESRGKAVACIRRMGAGRLVLLVTHDKADAEALNAQVVAL